MRTAIFFAILGLGFPTTGLAQTPVPQPIAPGDEHQVSFNGESYKMFPAKIQPVLTNLCATCHARADHASDFKLVRVDNGFANPRETARNIRSAAKFLTRENPSASPLLVKAVTPHGGAKDAPMFARTHPAFKNLELWAHWASLPEGSPQPKSIVAVRGETVARAETGAITVSQTPPTPMPAGSEPGRLPAVSSTPLGSLGELSPKPAGIASDPGTPNPDDPFDPAVFNRLSAGK